MKAAIRAQVRAQQERPVDWANYLRAALDSEMLERERQAQTYEEHAAMIGRQTALPLMGSVSQAAQRIRNRLAVEIGGEDWYLGVA